MCPVAWRNGVQAKAFWVCAVIGQTLFTICPATAEDKKKHLFYESFDAAFDGLFLSEGYDYTLPFRDNAGEGIVRIQGTQGSGFFPTVHSRSGTAISRYLQTRLMAGVMTHVGTAEIKLFGGFDIIEKYTTPLAADPVGGWRVGPTAMASMWWQVHRHAMISMEGGYTTAFSSFSFRLAPGITWPEGVSFGPEFGISGQAGSARLRAGLHLTGVTWESFSFRLQAGYARNDNGSQGFYAALSSWQRF